MLSVYRIHSSDENLLRAVSSAGEALAKAENCCPENLVSGGWVKKVLVEKKSDIEIVMEN